MLPLLALLLAATPVAPDFDTEVLPVLTKAGCNAGACHGAAIGRGGFKLSLWGSDPAPDYEAVVHELEGRRVNLAEPARSLLLAKPTGRLEHGGDVRLEEDGPGERLIIAWLDAGAPRLHRRKLVALDVTPERLVIDPAASVAIRAIAAFDDGTREDVTPWTVFTPNDAAAVRVDGSDKAHVLRRGQNIVVVRYLDHVRAIELLTPLSAVPVDLSVEPRRNFIDEHVLDLLATLRLPVSPAAGDDAFLRRVSLDLTGTLPTSAEVRELLADTRPDKRDRLIERLLDSEAFTDFWTWRWASLFQLDSARMNAEGVAAFQAWLRQQVSTNQGWDKIAAALLTAEGDSFAVGPANFTRATPSPRDQAESVSQALMGVRLRCANCHNHPLDRWTQDDYHGLAAIFARLERGRIVKVGSRGEVTHPRTGEPATPRLPGERMLAEGIDGRQELSRWLTGGDNRYFARGIANRLWKAMFGRGLVEPVDDLRDTNPATHPALLERLSADLVEHGYDLRHTLRLIAHSATYARSSQVRPENAADDRFYSHAPARPLPAAVLLDAWSAATGVPGEYGELPAGSRAIALVDARVSSPSLDLLGRCPPGSVCTGDTGNAGDLAKALHVINGGALNDKLASQSHGEDHRKALWDDLLWGLLSCREFVTNH
ncbi:MAG: DUF1549 domain-containing protein [Planctomycetes bacterium]|nr:DUF1549 domain-containing protein [Planctomycetota bacterium]